jgi:hypothetical protein
MKRNTTRNYWRESDPEFNYQFRRRWFETKAAKPPASKNAKQADAKRKVVNS